MRMGRDEALDLLRKWLAEGTLLRCNFDLLVFAATLRARVRDVAPDRLELLSDDATSEVVLPLRPDFEFGYGEPAPRSVDAQDSVCGLVILLSPSGPGLDPDAVLLTEIPPD